MISDQSKPHQKHAAIAKPNLGEFHRNELAILGAPCGEIQQLVKQIINQLSGSYQIAYVDADHKVEPLPTDNLLSQGAAVEFTDQINSRRLTYQQQFNSFEQKALFNRQDLVLVNGNHFKAKYQIAIIDDRKPLYKKLDRLTDVQLVLFTSNITALPEELIASHRGLVDVPTLSIHQTSKIAEFIQHWLSSRMPELNGLVLAGGKSARMQTDKGDLTYYGESQRLHTYNLLDDRCANTYISYADEQAVNREEGLPYITDKYLCLGPLGGIMSAFQQQPDAAWLTVACDLPFLSAETISYLIQCRNSSKLATAFLDPEGKFPEPLITIWEPRAYPVLLQFLSMGYSCPRKVLINSNIELLQAPNIKELQNINHPHERDEAMQQIKISC